ncbi:MAG: hypothetical protein ABIP54_04210 [Candidatus Andersenbacteria bacterium]
MKSNKNSSESASATQHDLELLGGNLASRLSSVEDVLAIIKDRLIAVEDNQKGFSKELGEHKQILLDLLEMITAMNSKLSVIPRHDDRIENHEERIEKVEVKVRILEN